MRTGQRELGLIMVKHGWCPSRGIMTLCTIQIKVIGGVIGISRGIIILLVAGKTIAGGVGIAVGMTVDALESNMRTR